MANGLNFNTDLVMRYYSHVGDILHTESLLVNCHIISAKPVIKWWFLENYLGYYFVNWEMT